MWRSLGTRLVAQAGYAEHRRGLLKVFHTALSSSPLLQADHYLSPSCTIGCCVFSPAHFGTSYGNGTAALYSVVRRATNILSLSRHISSQGHLCLVDHVLRVRMWALKNNDVVIVLGPCPLIVQMKRFSCRA